MINTDNLSILKTSLPMILEQMKPFDEKKNKRLTEIEETRNGSNTISIAKENKKVYLHSKYNPLREAETIVAALENVDENTNIIFYGTGLGYHIQMILEKFKDINYYIYEPIPELLYSFLSNVNLKKLHSDRLIGMDTDFTGHHLGEFVDRNRKKIKVVELPSHVQHFPEEFEEFNQSLLKLIKGKRNSIATNYSFQKRWVVNSIKNFNEVMNTPNILIEKADAFKGKSAVLVAAGPSLNDEIDNLREIHEKGSAYIFSVGSSINTLIHHDIYPDAACTYDPGAFNQNVFKTIKEKNIENVPMIFGSSVGYETLEDYPGEKYHMITSQDTVAGYFLKNKSSEPIFTVQDAPSIAVVTLQLLSILGFSNVILVGQNLGYRGKERYSEGISYSKELTDDEIKHGIWVKDVKGNEILTNETFNSMRNQMEEYIKYLPNISVINTTKGGAHIEGTKFIDLKSVMENELTKRIVSDTGLKGNKTNYDREYLNTKIKNMDKSYKYALKNNEEYKLTLTKIEKALKNCNYTQTEKLYPKLNKDLQKIERNDFYKTFILPMNRVQYKVLADSINSLNEEKDPYTKGEKIIASFSKFIDICTTDIEMIEPIYDEMKGQKEC